MIEYHILRNSKWYYSLSVLYTVIYFRTELGNFNKLVRELETFMVNTGTVLLTMNSGLDCAVNLSVVMDTMDTGNTLPSTSIFYYFIFPTLYLIMEYENMDRDLLTVSAAELYKAASAVFSFFGLHTRRINNINVFWGVFFILIVIISVKHSR